MAQDIVLQQFVYTPDYKDHFVEQAQQQDIPDEMRQRLNSFQSTPRFIKCLTSISHKLGMMKEATKSEKLHILRLELQNINQHLPASVYIPFVQNSTRNYCVLHIPPEEARVFQTKERAPIMLAIEVFRPDEMAINLKEKKNKQILSRMMSTDNPYEINDLEAQLLPDKPQKGLKHFFDKKKRENRDKKLRQKEHSMEKKADQSISK